MTERSPSIQNRSTRTAMAGTVLALATFAAVSGPAVANTTDDARAPVGQKIILTASDGQEARATLLDNATARAFAEKLPLTIRMGDHFQRELYGAMEPITVSDPLQKTYRAGDIGYWPPAPGFAIYYTVAGPTIPGDGVAILGSIDSNLEIFANGGIEVTIERAE